MTFENVGENDQKLIEEATLHYFKNISGDVSCIVDRFDCYPAKLTSPISYRPVTVTSAPGSDYISDKQRPNIYYNLQRPQW